MAAVALVGAMPVARLEVSIEGLRSERGLVRVCVVADPAKFPTCVDNAASLKRSLPATTHLVSFDALPQGTYALAVIHDENANSRLDTFAGIPREGFGFSRNPPIRFGAPRFAAARFDLADDAAMQQVRMRYIF